VAESSAERIVAMGGPNTSQQIKDKDRSFNRTRIVFFFLGSALRVLPIKFINKIIFHP
jgi:hypothetical protein